MDTLLGEITAKIVLPPFWKMVLSKKEEFAPKGSKFFPLRVDPFSEVIWWSEEQTVNHTVISLVNYGEQATKCLKPF